MSGSHRDRGSENDPPGDFYIRSTKVSKNRSMWAQEGPVLGSKVCFLGARMGSENGPFLDPLKLLIILDPGPECPLLHSKIQHSQHRQDC